MIKEPLTLEEKELNAVAAKDLIRGKYYKFDPAVEATGFPVGGPGVCEAKDLKFNRGCYLGYKNESHVFQGKPGCY